MEQLTRQRGSPLGVLRARTENEFLVKIGAKEEEVSAETLRYRDHLGVIGVIHLFLMTHDSIRPVCVLLCRRIFQSIL